MRSQTLAANVSPILAGESGFLFNINMRLENLLREKVYAFAQNAEPSAIEKKMLAEIFARDELGEIKLSRIIDNNDNYDSYHCKTWKGEFCVKITLDAEDQTIERDAGALSWLNLETPIIYSCGELKSWNAKYSVQEFIRGQSVSELGKSFLYKNKEPFVDGLISLHNTESSECRSFSEFLADEYVSDAAIKKIETIDFSKDQEAGEICITELHNLSEEIKRLYSPVLESKEYLHGGITPSRLILSDGVKFINFDHSFRGHPLIDLLSLKYEFFLHESVEAEIVNLYKRHRQFSNEEYFAAAKIIKVMKFYDLIMEFIKQVYIYKGVRARKILELTEKMSRSFGHFSGLESFERHKNKIAELFTSSVI